MAMSKLNGKVVVIIGGSAGIGFAVARAAHAEGAAVIIASSTDAKVAEAVTEMGGQIRGHVLDVTDEAAVEKFFAKVGKFDHLVFTAGDAGYLPPVPVTELDLTALKDLFKVRFWNALAAVKHGARQIAPDGSITLTDGMFAHRPMKGAAVSTAMLGAVEYLVKGLAFDLAPIRVNTVCPGLTMTDRTKGFPADMLKARAASLPMKRIGEPEDCAEAYLYAMRAGYTTGQVLRVDGGSSLI
ncbi:MAG: SDR family oxidoreductase [Phenylobacterium sp.]